MNKLEAIKARLAAVADEKDDQPAMIKHWFDFCNYAPADIAALLKVVEAARAVTTNHDLNAALAELDAEEA